MNTTFKERLIQEQSDLNEKIEKLKAFIDGNEIFKTLPEEQQNLLHKQFYYMDCYKRVLIRRIELLNKKE